MITFAFRWARHPEADDPARQGIAYRAWVQVAQPSDYNQIFTIGVVFGKETPDFWKTMAVNLYRVLRDVEWDAYSRYYLTEMGQPAPPNMGRPALEQYFLRHGTRSAMEKWAQLLKDMPPKFMGKL